MKLWPLAVPFAAIVLAAAAVIGVVSKPTIVQAPHDFTYRRTAVYESGGKTYQASGIVATRVWNSRGGINSSAGWRVSHKGEALWVDIPDVGRVVTAFEVTTQFVMFSETCGTPLEFGHRSTDDAYALLDKFDAAFTGTCNVPAENTPTVVVFPDPNDLASARAFANSAVLPDGMQLVSFTIERTTDPVTFTTGNIQPNGHGTYVDIMSGRRSVGSIPVGPALFRRSDFFP